LGEVRGRIAGKRDFAQYIHAPPEQNALLAIGIWLIRV
jgi:hypothetical protein